MTSFAAILRRGEPDEVSFWAIGFEIPSGDGRILILSGGSNVSGTSRGGQGNMEQMSE